MMTDRLTVVDMHTGGEPVRIVTGGYPPLPKGTILEKRSFVRDQLDHLRRILIFEPRGHADMYGALLVEPFLPEADLAVLFMHNEGYSTMCGHAIIALGRYAVDHGLVPAREPVTTVGVECPCGLVLAQVEVRNGRAGRVSFESVPSFLFAADLELTVEGYGRIRFDIAYGGAYYAIATADQFGLSFGESRAGAFIEAASALTETVKAAVPLDHPDHPDLAFLYGSILTDGHDGSAGRPSRNACVFADAQLDRSPTGSGVSARLAALHHKGLAGLGEMRLFESIVGSVFSGELVRHAKAGAQTAVVVRVAGMAHYCGEATFTLEPDDVLGQGFLVR
jgi:trans-L-3-hydroxyproline dehydratase